MLIREQLGNGSLSLLPDISFLWFHLMGLKVNGDFFCTEGLAAEAEP